MKTQTLADFVHVTFSTRIVTARADVIEVTPLGDSIQVYTFHYPPGEIRDTHTHEEDRLTFVRSGCMELTIEGTSHILKPGDQVFVLAHIPHRLAVLGDEPLYITELVSAAR